MQRNVSQAENNQLLMKRIGRKTNRFGIRESTSNKDQYFKSLLEKTNENGLQLDNSIKSSIVGQSKPTGKLYIAWSYCIRINNFYSSVFN